MKLGKPFTRKVETGRTYVFHPSPHIITTDGTENIKAKIKQVIEKRKIPYDLVEVYELNASKPTPYPQAGAYREQPPERYWYPYVRCKVANDQETISELLNVDVACGYSPKTLAKRNKKYKVHKEGNELFGVEWIPGDGFDSKAEAVQWINSRNCQQIYNAWKLDIEKEKGSR